MRSMTLASSAVATACASAFALFALAVGCGSSSGPTSGAGGGSGSTDIASLTYSAAAAVDGSVDDHCAGDAGTIVQTVSAAACHPDAGSATDQGVSDYGPTMYGSSGSDDDCKYHVKWESTTLGEGRDTYFRVTATVASAMDAPLTGATPILEVYLSTTHPAPNTNQAPTETAPGVYIVGPIQFDAPGEWTVRFHFDESCSDVSPDSPHGHAAFYVDVP